MRIAAVFVVVAVSSVAHAQNSTTGAILGVANDPKRAPIPGVTITVTSPALGGPGQSCFTDEHGACKSNGLPPGDYIVTFFYAGITIRQTGVHVGVDQTVSVIQAIDEAQAKHEVIVIRAPPPHITIDDQKVGMRIDKQYIHDVPSPGRTFESLIGAAAGAQNDGYGIAFSGSTAYENSYIVDGSATTSLTYGASGSPVVNDFIEEIEVMTGGYQAEYGRATGAVVNVVTKTGTNEFHGSIFAYWQPGQLTWASVPINVNASSIAITPNLNFDADAGFELGGPIIRNKLWFFVGIDPRFSQTDYTRAINAQTDCRTAAKSGVANGDIPGLSRCDPLAYGDGVPDIDPHTGFFITDPVCFARDATGRCVQQSEIRSATTHVYNMLAKLNYAATPQHQGQLAIEAMPSGSSTPGLVGPSNVGSTTQKLTTDVSAKWTSKFNEDRTEITAVVGWHRDYAQSDALDPSLEALPAQVLQNGDLLNYASGGTGSNAGGFKTFDNQPAEAQSTVDACAHNNARYPKLGEPCPMVTEPYFIDGPGAIQRDTEERKAAKVELTHRARLLGTHEIKIGLDGEDNTLDKARLYSGGEIITNIIGQEIDTARWVKLGGNINNGMNPDPSFFNQTCTTPNPHPATPRDNTVSFYCAYLRGIPDSRGTQIHGETLDWAGYLRDSWQPRPNIAINVGVRYEEQYLRYASFLQNTADPLTGDKLGANAMQLKGNWAPRLGVSWDPTKEARSKLYASYGRFYEAIPMDINERSFGGEVSQSKRYSPGQCGASDPRLGGPDGKMCDPAMPGGVAADQLIGASGELIEPGIGAEYIDEYIAGAELAALPDLKVGVAYNHRAFGRIIEDVSTDGANTYIIANPGEFSAVEEQKLVSQIAATDDPTQKAHLQNELNLFRGIRGFDHGVRNYDSLVITLSRRFSRRLYMQGSYTYSRTYGNYPGSISYQNGQIDPNISSQFDLIELTANRYGPLPQDRPHVIKLDASYMVPMRRFGDVTFGIRFRAVSGVPISALGSHYLYGANESYILPQGAVGRTDFDHGLDLRVTYGKWLRRPRTKFEGAIDIYNLYNRQGTFNVDNTYAESFRLLPAGSNGAQSATLQNVNPISGGSYADLLWAKVISVDRSNQPVQTAQPIGRNANFKNTTSRYAPEYIRVSLRLMF